MRARTASALRCYAFPPAAVAAAYLAALPLDAEAPYVAHPLFLGIVAGSAFLGGLRAGLVATAASLVVVGYSLGAPFGRTLLADPTAMSFAIVSLVVAGLLGARGRLENERDDLEDAVAIERERLEMVLDSAHIGIGFLDTNLRFLQANQALAEINAVPVREHLGRRVREVTPWMPDRVLAILRAALAGESSIGIEIAIDDRRLPGGMRHFSASFLPLRGASGTVHGVGFTVNEVTSVRQSEEEQMRLRARAEQAQRAADAANQMKDEFLITLAHELRSPLQGILGWNRLLRGGRLDVKRSDQALETIERIVRQQAELLNGLFDVSLIMAGKMEIKSRPVDLSELVRQAFADKQFSAARHGITIECDAASEVPSVGDPERIHQILGNLLTNAIKFTPEGGRVQVSCRAEGGEGVITVRDSGEGIPSDFLAHIFERFSQADRSRVRRRGGLGLGLSIVHHLVELHEGSVVAESSGPGGGTTVTVRLPLAIGAVAGAAPVVAATPLAPVSRIARRLPGVRVLLVEDDVHVRESTAALLEMQGAQVTTAESAAAAIEAFRGARPDVVISDLGLPGEDGYVFLRRLRALDDGSDVPVIAFSGYARENEAARSREAGCVAYLVKPVDPQDMMHAVAAALASDLR